MIIQITVMLDWKGYDEQSEKEEEHEQTTS